MIYTRTILVVISTIFAINIAYSEDNRLNDKVINQLKIGNKKIVRDLITSKILPYDTCCRLFVIPIATVKEEGYWEGDVYLIKISNIDTLIKTKTLLKKVIMSDAVNLNEIVIDTAPYYINENKRAFALRYRYDNNSFANGYKNEQFMLIDENDNLFSIILSLDSYERYYLGSYENDTEIKEQKSTFTINKDYSNNAYYNIIENVHFEHKLIHPNSSEKKVQIKNYRNVFQFINGKYECKNKKNTELNK